MIYICVPAYNEEQTVGVVLWKVRQVMAELARDYQLLVADDGSTDRTPSVLEPYTRVLPLTVLRNEQTRGYADSLEMLLREAVRRSEYPRRDIIVVLQADFSEDPEHVTTLIRRIESGADIVVSNAGYGERQPPRAFRWGRALLNRMLRRFSWPDGAHDPLTGLNAYRVFCVKRAVEERSGGRLLRFDAWVANAELLRESAPHARRVDAVDLTVRRERLQRPERFQLGPLFHEVFAFIRNRPAARRSVEQLAADRVIGGRSQYRTLSAESLRESSATNGARSAAGRRGAPQRRGRPAGEREERPGRGRSGERVRSRPGKGTVAAGEGAEAPARRPPAERERPRGEPRPRRPRPAAAAPAEAATEAPAAEIEAAEARPAPPRKRRPRKRGRRTGTDGSPATAPGAVPEGTSLSAEASEAQPVRNDEGAPFVLEGGEPAAAGGEAPRKRRRGSRGGRRRNRSGGGGSPEPNENEPSSGPEAPPDTAAAS